MRFNFEDGFECIDEALQEVKEVIFKIPQDPLDFIQTYCTTQLCHVLECYNVTSEEEEEDPRNINIPEAEDLKGIIRDLGVMKIMLKPNAKPVKQRPYRLNPKYKEKFYLELDKMLAAEIIEPLEESDWVSPMVVQEKKQEDEIRICLDLRKLNDA
eukprot:PITA_31878